MNNCEFILPNRKCTYYNHICNVTEGYNCTHHELNECQERERLKDTAMEYITDGYIPITYISRDILTSMDLPRNIFHILTNTSEDYFIRMVNTVSERMDNKALIAELTKLFIEYIKGDGDATYERQLL